MHSLQNEKGTGPGISKRKVFGFALLIVSVSTFLLSCERDIDIKLIEQEPKLVVEATIENGQPPVVFLSRSLDYFSQISLQILSQSLVHNADIFMSNGSKTHKLKEYSTPLPGGFSVSYYSIDSSDLATAFLGELNTRYALRIVADGKEYSARASIPALTKRIDSIWWRNIIPQGDTLGDVSVLVRATDPPGFGDYIRYFTKRNSEPFFSPSNSAFDDLFVDGTTYELPIERGHDRNVKITDENRFFRKGDTVTLKLCNIDKATYDFWRTMEFSYQSVGNPFSTPVKVEGNISGNALGYFGAYAAQYRTLVVPK